MFNTLSLTTEDSAVEAALRKDDFRVTVSPHFTDDFVYGATLALRVFNLNHEDQFQLGVSTLEQYYNFELFNYPTDDGTFPLPTPMFSQLTSDQIDVTKIRIELKRGEYAIALKDLDLYFYGGSTFTDPEQYLNAFALTDEFRTILTEKQRELTDRLFGDNPPYDSEEVQIRYQLGQVREYRTLGVSYQDSSSPMVGQQYSIDQVDQLIDRLKLITDYRVQYSDLETELLEEILADATDNQVYLGPGYAVWVFKNLDFLNGLLTISETLDYEIDDYVMLIINQQYNYQLI